MPTRDLTGVAPYEAWSKKKPDLEHLRIFGCVVYTKIPTVNVKMLDNRSKCLINIGTKPGTMIRMLK